MLMSEARERGRGEAADEAARWRAVSARDRSWDGRFVYAVQTTGVYCRPSCPARRPHRRNVAFFAAAAAAEQAGFRSCRRCRPLEVGLADARTKTVREACRLLTEDRDEPWRLGALAKAVGVSPRHLLRTFKDTLGVTPRQYAAARRLAAFKGRLKKGDSVTGALYDVGFGSSSRLYEDVQGRLGMTPATYRRGGRGMTIGYTVARSPLGSLLVAATARGVAAVSLGDSEAALEAALRAEYPQAEIARDDGGLQRWVALVLAHISGPAPRTELPLDVQATAFQHRVWQELRAIPRGETRSYSEVARRIGSPKASRAVARACASNRVALIVPCHRVVEAGGGLGGYRWGVARKRALLDAEKERPAAAEAGGRRRRR
jgi:AraC family transcriptional regulator, regulatory protein of adaptative response / methylated-DNA-[protein]-cysteine methyltransferase